MKRVAAVTAVSCWLSILSGSCTTEERVVVLVGAQGRTFIDRDAVERDALEAKLREMAERRGLRVVYVEADVDVTQQEIWNVIDIIDQAGVESVGMLYVDPENRQTY